MGKMLKRHDDLDSTHTCANQTCILHHKIVHAGQRRTTGHGHGLTHRRHLSRKLVRRSNKATRRRRSPGATQGINNFLRKHPVHAHEVAIRTHNDHIDWIRARWHWRISDWVQRHVFSEARLRVFGRRIIITRRLPTVVLRVLRQHAQPRRTIRRPRAKLREVQCNPISQEPLRHITSNLARTTTWFFGRACRVRAKRQLALHCGLDPYTHRPFGTWHHANTHATTTIMGHPALRPEAHTTKRW